MKITILYSASYKGRQTERHGVKIVDPSQPQTDKTTGLKKPENTEYKVSD